MRYLSLVLVLLLVMAVGCGHVIEGKKIDGAMTKDLLAPGTDEKKVVEMFGQPQQKENLANGETKYIYYYRETSRMLFFHRSKADPKDQRRLEVLFRGNEVQRYRYVYAELAPITADIAPIETEKK